MKGASIIVTGGAGYIGSHACKILNKLGFNPITIDNLSVGHKSAVKWGPFVHADLKDKDALDKTFSKYKPCAVMHFAADALVAESVINPGKYYENNVYSTVVLLEQMVKHNIRNFIFSSSCATYGIPTSSPISEDHPQKPINPYGKSKLMIEEILKDYEHAHGIKFASLRYFNAAGADFEGDTGENHENETHLIPLVIQTAEGLRPFINVYGMDYPTDDGSAIRDYIHVVDLIDAHVKALNYIYEKSSSLMLNLGTGKGISVLEVINTVKKITKKDFKVNFSERRPGDPPILFADSFKAKKIIGWQPKHSDIETIIITAWNWHKSLIQKKP